MHAHQKLPTTHDETRPLMQLKPSGHGRLDTDAPSSHWAPSAHSPVVVDKPVPAQNLPAGHGIMLAEPHGQKWPERHTFCLGDVDFAGQ